MQAIKINAEHTESVRKDLLRGKCWQQSESACYFSDIMLSKFSFFFCECLSTSLFSPWNERWLHDRLPPLSWVWSYLYLGASRAAAECVHAERPRSCGSGQGSQDSYKCAWGISTAWSPSKMLQPRALVIPNIELNVCLKLSCSWLCLFVPWRVECLDRKSKGPLLLVVRCNLPRTSDPGRLAW